MKATRTVALGAAAVLVVLVAIIAFDTSDSAEPVPAPGPDTSVAGSTSSSTSLTPTSNPTTSAEMAPSIVTLPPASPSTFLTTSDGAFAIAPGGTVVIGVGSLVRYQVEVEMGIDVSVEDFAAFVDETLRDERSWVGGGDVAVQRVSEGADIVVVLATPGTVDALCSPLRTNGVYSCGRNGRAVINLDRWLHGVEGWTGDLMDYRQYVVNHEVGHLFGHQHIGCPAPGAVAPVMMQQSKGLQGCLPNGWPYP